ncbi:uncharacterized protein LOC121369820 [Gigantopelta aegis]|uniref:uncharacterized protein LOC121369820 n=1 Tax=Gigantopelta aegis TaxID=1735272 RepID=UPI001B88C6AA|nr:uncharacterized protein LOC121369820 [Gigantopelta aegis]
MAVDAINNVIPLQLFKAIQNVPSERLLAPVLSEACLLWILKSNGTSEDDISLSTAIEVERCINEIIKSANFVQLHIDAILSADLLFKSGIEKQCAHLNATITELSRLKQQLQNSGNKTIASRIYQAASSVLCVCDEVRLRKITLAIEKVKEAVFQTQKIYSEKESVSYLMTLDHAKLVLLDLCEDYHTDILDRSLRDTFMSAVHKVRDSVRRLEVTLQRDRTESEQTSCKSEVEEQITELCSSLSELSVIVNYPMTQHNTEIVPKPVFFVTNVEKILMAYSEASRYGISPNVDVWMGRIVEHSLNIALLCRICQPDYKYVILDNCKRLLQVNRRAVELSVIVRARMGCLQIRTDLEIIQETVKDELLELEENVNLALVGLIVEVFTETTEPIENLANDIIHSHEDKCYQVPECVVTKFIHHSTQICQVALLVAASSSDTEGIKHIESAVSGLKTFHRYALSAVRGDRRMAGTDVVEHVKSVEKGWSVHVSSLLHVLYDIMEPEVFLEVAGKSIHSDICVTFACLLHNDQRQAVRCIQRVLGQSKQFSQCACQTLSNSADGVFRIGFQVYVNQLNSAINSLQDVTHHLLEDLCNPRYKVLIETHLNDLHKTIKGVRLNVSKVNHLDILNVIKDSRCTDIKVNKSASSCVPQCLQKLLPIKLVAESVPSDVLNIHQTPLLSSGSKLNIHQTPLVSSGSMLNINQTPLVSSGPKLNIHETPLVSSGSMLNINQTPLVSSGSKSNIHQTPLVSSGSMLNISQTPLVSSGPKLNIHQTPLVSSGSMLNINQTPLVSLGSKSNIHQTPLVSSGLKSNIHQTSPVSSGSKQGVTSQNENDKVSSSSLCDLSCTNNSNDVLGSSHHLVSLSENLVKAAMADNEDELKHLLSDLIHWTNHTVDCAQKLLLYGDVVDKRELENLCNGISHLSSKISDTAKSTDEQKQDVFHTDCKAWSVMLDRACVLIDDIVEQWKSCTDLILELAGHKDHSSLVSQVDILVSNQQTMTDLLTRAASFFMSEKLASESGLTFLHKSIDDLVDVTGKIKKLSNEMSDSDSVLRLQMCRLCREWAVVMFCSQCFLKTVSAQIIEDEGCKILGFKWAQINEEDMAELFQKMDEEMINIGGLLDCVSVGNDENKSRSFELVSKLTSVLEDIQTCVQENSPLSDMPPILKLRKNVLLAQWIMKVIEAREMIKVETKDFLEVLDHFETSAIDMNMVHDDSSDEFRLSEFKDHLNQMKNNMLAIQKKVLLAIKICPNLVKRNLIGRYLNELTSLTSELVTGWNSLATSGENLRTGHMDPEVSQLKLEWAAKIKRLTLTLKNMPDIRASLVPEIKKLINSLLVQPTEHPENKKPVTKTSTSGKSDSRLNLQKREDNSPDLNSNQNWKITSNLSCTATRYTLLYQDPDYLPWADDSNAVVKLARRIAEDMLTIEHFSRSGQFDTAGINRLFEKAQAVAENGSRMGRFFKVLMDYSENSLVGELMNRTELIATYSSQLQMITNGLKNSARSSQTVLILLQNSKNLVGAILDAFVAAEVVCIKGLQKPVPDICSEDESILDLVTQWQQTLLKFQAKENSRAPIDELGLRRVDQQCSPSLTDVLKIPS